MSAHARFAERGVSPAWALEGRPIVNTGPASDLGHTHPSDTNVVVDGGWLAR